MSILNDRGIVPLVKALFHVHVFVSINHQLCSLLYPVRQQHNVCRVYAEEDVQDFRQLRPSLDPPQVVVLFLCAERALHRCRPHSGQFLNERESVDHYVVHLSSEFNTLAFLAPHYRSHIRLAMLTILFGIPSPQVLALEEVLLLAEYQIFQVPLLTSINFVIGRWISNFLLNSHIVSLLFSIHSHNSFGSVGFFISLS